MLKKEKNNIFNGPSAHSSSSASTSDTWNISNYQFDSTGFNWDNFEAASFEQQRDAYINMCALQDYSNGAMAGLGQIETGSVQNVSNPGRPDCIGKSCGTIGNTVARMGTALNAAFHAEVEAGRLFPGEGVDPNFDYATYLKGEASNYTADILGSLSGFSAQTGESDDFGSDLNPAIFSDPEKLGEAYSSIASKDPSEWTDEDKYIIAAYHEDLASRVSAEKAKADENGMYATDSMSYDLIYGDYEKLNSELTALEKGMKSEGMMEYSKWEKGWQDIKNAGETLITESKDVVGAIKEGDWKSALVETADLVTQAKATGSVVVGDVVSGAADLVEEFADGVKVIKTAAATPTTYIIDKIAGTDITGKMWNATMNDVERDKVGEIREWFYEDTAIGRNINANSALKYDSVGSEVIRESGKKAAEVAVITAATVATGGAAAVPLAGIGFAVGTGEEAERRFGLKDAEGNYTNRSAKDVGMTFLSGAAEAAEWYGTSQAIGAAVQGVNAVKEVGFSGIKDAITSSVAGSSKKEVVGKLAKGAAHSLVEADTWVDVGTGVVDFVVDGVNTGEWNWGSLAVDTALNFGGNMLGGSFGGLLDGNPGKGLKDIDTPKSGGTPLTDVGKRGIAEASDAGLKDVDELFEGNLDNIKGGQPRILDTDSPRFGNTPLSDVGKRGIAEASDAGLKDVDELFESDLQNVKVGQPKESVDISGKRPTKELLSDDELENVWGAGLFDRPKNAPKGYAGLPSKIYATDSPDFIKGTLMKADVDDCIKLSKTASPDQMRGIATDIYISKIDDFNARGISYTDYLESCGIKVVEPKTKLEAATIMGDKNLWLQEKIKSSPGFDPSRHSFGRNGDFDFDSEFRWAYSKGFITNADIDEFNQTMVGKGLLKNQQYTPKQKAAIFNYTACGGFEINAYLNDGYINYGNGQRVKARSAYGSIADIQDAISGYRLSGNGSNRVFPSSSGSIVDRLDSAIRHTNYDDAIVTHRGTGHIYNNGVQIDPFSLKVGDKILTSDGFSSSSLLPENTFKDNYILEIVVPPQSGLGAYIEPMAGVGSYGQMEVLLKRGGGMVVAGDAYKTDFFGDGVMRTVLPVIMTE